MSEATGFIGLGQMGGPMARRLATAGIPLVVYDPSDGAIARIQGATVQAAATSAEVGSKCGVVLLSLPTPEIVRDVVLGADGVSRGGAVHTIVDLSTTGPVVARELDSELRKRGVSLIDAPVSGGVAGASNGTLSLMVAGAPDAVSRAQGILSHLGKAIVIGDECGQGQLMKLLNNFLTATAMAATAEAVAFGAKGGLDRKIMLDVFNASSGRNTATADKFPRSLLDRSFNFGFRSDLMLKDVKLAMETADAIGAPLWIGSVVRQMWSATVTRVGSGDFTRIAETAEIAAGISEGGSYPRNS
jgi:3-hydroxyisobutyrate dehydrogenase-like beta-hydroxyacid dehydrogenase